MFDLVEVRVLGDTKVFLIILFKMYHCLHCRGHKYYPDDHVDVDLFHVVVWWTTKLSSYV